MGILAGYHQLMLGNVFGSGHPIHPITVHYPITALLAAYTCDILVHTRKSLPRLISASLPSTPLLAQIAYYTNAAGLIFLIPSAITGAHEAYEIWKHLGGKKVDGGVVLQAYPERAFNVAAIHGAMNLGVGAYALYVWLSRRKNPSHMSTPKQGIASAIFLATLIGSATLGGKLVYDYGIGVQRMGSAIEEKKLMWKDLNPKKADWVGTIRYEGL